jgi:predicted O-methyltransferase YrrM
VTYGGTDAYAGLDDTLPAPVAAALELARASDFDQSCVPEHGELLRVLARGVGAGRIGETGTGCGVGLAWLASGAHQDAHLVSVEHDAQRAARAARLFLDHGNVEVLHDDWQRLRMYGPFDLLVLDGGGQGKGPEQRPLDPEQWLVPGGLIVMDDFGPLTSWPPRFGDGVDTARMHWLAHPRMRATQVRVTSQWSTLLATYVG